MRTEDFVVAGQAAVVHQPAEGALDGPAPGLDNASPGDAEFVPGLTAYFSTTDRPEHRASVQLLLENGPQ